MATYAEELALVYEAILNQMRLAGVTFGTDDYTEAEREEFARDAADAVLAALDEARFVPPEGAVTTARRTLCLRHVTVDHPGGWLVCTNCGEARPKITNTPPVGSTS